MFSETMIVLALLMLDRMLQLMRALNQRFHLSLPQTLTVFLLAMFVASLLCLLLFAQVADAMMDARAMVEFDQQLAQALYDRATERWIAAFALLTLFGSEVVFVITVAVGLAYALRRRWYRLGIWLVALAGGQLLNLLLKAMFARERPVFADPIVVERFYSFPSGHAMLSMICYGLLAYLLVERARRRRTKVAIVALASVFILMIGFSRLYLGVHFFSDVIAGFLAGGAWLFACIAALAYLRQRQERHSARSPGVEPAEN